MEMPAMSRQHADKHLLDGASAVIDKLLGLQFPSCCVTIGRQRTLASAIGKAKPHRPLVHHGLGRGST
jgi:hypothetical protein